MPTSILRKAEIRARSLGYNLSQYVQHLLREDFIRQRGDLPRSVEQPHVVDAAAEQPPKFKAKPRAK